MWFKLFLYSKVKNGPPSLLLVKGTRLRKLPKMFMVREFCETFFSPEAQSVMGLYIKG